MTPRDWRRSLRLTQDRAATAVGVSPRQWKRYEAGEAEIPGPVLLAMEHVSQSRAALLAERDAAAARLAEIDQQLGV